MLYENFIEPTSVSVLGREFVISKIPAFTAMRVFEAYAAAAREKGLLSKVLLPEGVVREVLSHVAVRNADGDMEALDTTAKVEAAFPDYAAMVGVVAKMTEYNFGFFDDGSLLDLLGVPEEAAESD